MFKWLKAWWNAPDRSAWRYGAWGIEDERIPPKPTLPIRKHPYCCVCCTPEKHCKYCSHA